MATSQGDLVVDGNPEETYKRIVDDFRSSLLAGDDALLLAPRRVEVGHLNHLARLALRDQGTLGEDEIVIQGDRVALFWTAYGTHEGRLMNIPPTHRKIAVRGASLLTVENEKISHGLYVWDVAGLLRSIGLLPDL